MLSGSICYLDGDMFDIWGGGGGVHGETQDSGAEEGGVNEDGGYLTIIADLVTYAGLDCDKIINSATVRGKLTKTNPWGKQAPYSLNLGTSWEIIDQTCGLRSDVSDPPSLVEGITVRFFGPGICDLQFNPCPSPRAFRIQIINSNISALVLSRQSAPPTPAHETPAPPTPAPGTSARPTPASETPICPTPARPTPACPTPTHPMPAPETPAPETPAPTVAAPPSSHLDSQPGHIYLGLESNDQVDNSDDFGEEPHTMDSGRRSQKVRRFHCYNLTESSQHVPSPRTSLGASSIPLPHQALRAQSSGRFATRTPSASPGAESRGRGHV
ncbi:hypothetical protein OF83DRAFT_1088859, partial [Amylostereum chailletii]